MKTHPRLAQKSRKVLCFIFCCYTCYCNVIAQPAVTNDSLILTTTASLTMTFSGSFLNQRSGTIANAGTINVSGDWTNNASNNVFTGSTGSLNLNGSSPQTIGGIGSTIFHNLGVSNTSATSPQVIFGNTQFITNQLTLTQGNVDLSGNTLSIGTSGTNIGSILYAGGWIYGGTFKKWFNTSTIPFGSAAGLFPVGSSTEYRPFSISAPVTGPSTAGTISVTHTSVGTITPVMFNDINMRMDYRFDSYWTVTTGSGLSGGSFDLSAEGTGFPGISDVNILRLTLIDSSLGTFGTNAGTILNPQVNRLGLTSSELADHFYFSYTSSPLPVELISFNATYNNETVDLKWETASELNNDFFIVEHSMDLKHFDIISTVKGVGNSTNKNAYYSNDPSPKPGLNYYRLRQTDFDGKETYSSVKMIFLDQSNTPWVNANMNSDQLLELKFNSRSNGAAKISVYSAMGSILQNSTSKNVSSGQILNLDCSNMASGVYYLMINDNDQSFTKKILKN